MTAPCAVCGAVDGAPHKQDCPFVVKIPTVWKSGDRAVIGDSPILPPSNDAEMNLLSGTHDVCGTCKYFELIEGQRLMQAQRFVERLVREQHWQAHHLASPLNQLGLCGAASSPGGDETVTGKLTKACDQWRKDGGLVTLRRRTA